MRKKIVAGNWKMNKTLAEARSLASEVLNLYQKEIVSSTGVVLCVPFPFLDILKSQLGNSHIQVGAQDCSAQESGAFTGEVSAAMLNSVGVPYVILGHSERRQYFGEDGKLLARKIDRALAHQLTPIFCCGESLEIRELGTHEELVRKHVEEGLFHLAAGEISKVVIAYEPVWAIGTGKTATSAQAQEMHAVIRKQLFSKYGEQVAQTVPILYGGSVKPDNSKELFSCPDVDGGLIGGASLKARDFIEIARSL